MIDSESWFSHLMDIKSGKINNKSIQACACEFSAFLRGHSLLNLFFTYFLLCFCHWHFTSTRFYYSKYLAFALEIWKRSLGVYNMLKYSFYNSLCNYYSFNKWMFELFSWLMSCFAKNMRTRYSSSGIHLNIHTDNTFIILIA